MLEEKGLPIPETYEDMLMPEYAGLISMPSPKSSGTGYSYYNGMVTILGEEAGMEYFEELNPNIKEYTELPALQPAKLPFAATWPLRMVCCGVRHYAE